MERPTEYAIVVEPLSEADGGGWLASAPALPGCMGDGETRVDAQEDALAAIEEWKDAARALGREVPGRDRACHARCMTS
jgi:antitoxin HicB